jgi:hypothetical protein
MNRLNRYASLLLTAAIAVGLESIITVEWTYPYCLGPTDGSAYAAQGWPLPYWMWNGVASLEHDFLPHVYLLNVLLISLLLFPAIRWVWNRAFSGLPGWMRSSIAIAAALLLLSQLGLTILMVNIGALRPSTNFLLANDNRYSDLRPVRVGLHRSNAPVCTPSSFWFPK